MSSDHRADRDDAGGSWFGSLFDLNGQENERQETAFLNEADGGYGFSDDFWNWADYPTALLYGPDTKSLPVSSWNSWTHANADLSSTAVQQNAIHQHAGYSSVTLDDAVLHTLAGEQCEGYDDAILAYQNTTLGSTSADSSQVYRIASASAHFDAVQDLCDAANDGLFPDTISCLTSDIHGGCTLSSDLSKTLSIASSAELGILPENGTQSRSQPRKFPGTGMFSLASLNSKPSFKAEKKRKRPDSDSLESDLEASKRGHNATTRHRSGVVCVRCKLMREGCSGTFPCERCVNQSKSSFWKNICVEAKFAQHGCFSKNLYLKRSQILLNNVRYWYPAKVRPRIHIKVSIGFAASLSIAVSAFDAIDTDHLKHINFRNLTSKFLRTTPTQPFGLYGMELTHEDLDNFFDAMLADLIEEQAAKYHHDFWRKTFQAAVKLSQKKRKDAWMFTRLLRIWAAHTIFFGHIWRVSEGGEAIGSVWHEEIGAFDVPRTLYWQLDCITEHYMHTLERNALNDLENFILKRESATWFSIYLGAFIYLAILEKDTWNLESWEAKSQRWASDPRVKLNPTMVWPLPDTSARKLIERNEHQAKIIASHVRARSKGAFPFSLGEDDMLIAAGGQTLREVKDFAAALSDDFHKLSQELMIGRTTAYSEEDSNSLDHKFTRLIIESGE